MDDYTRSRLRARMMARGGPGRHSSMAALILIAAGTVLFLDNLGLLPFAHVRAYWPLAISAFGVSRLFQSRCGSNIVWSWTMIAIGVLLTLGNLGIMHVGMGSLWPLFLIAAGASMLFRRTAGPRMPSTSPGENASIASSFSGGYLRENVAFSSTSRRIDSANFEGADLSASFGELKIDLRGATISTANREAVIEANATFGAIKLRIPEAWRVVVRGTAVFGTYEDKTVPPRPSPGVDPPTLVINGNSAFGAVEIEN